MSLSAVLAAFHTVLSAVPGPDRFPVNPPAMLSDNRMVLIYPQPGPSAPYLQAGRSGFPVYRHEETIIVEFHLRIAEDRIDEAIPESTELLDLVRQAIWTRQAIDQYGGVIDGITRIDTLQFGELGWGSDFTFGFRLGIELTHTDEYAWED